tara:strand:- start:23 stop:304 length:282 start_codon:yes stop_codon:yes gene_type:complete
MLPKNSENLTGLLDNFLCLNPFFRCSASEALKKNVFDDFRKKSKEKSAPQKINLAIDRDDAFDYEKCISTKYELKDYREIVLDTVNLVHKLRQ